MNKLNKVFTWNNVAIKANTNCKTLSGAKWLIVQCKKAPTKKLIRELKKAGAPVGEWPSKVIKIWFTCESKKQKYLDIIRGQKSNKFEIVEIYDCQFSLGKTFFPPFNIPQNERPKRFFIADEGDRITLYPTTLRQNLRGIVVDCRRSTRGLN